MSKVLFITGIDSEAGKSHATGWFARSLMVDGNTVVTQKFIQTGVSDGKDDIAIHRHIMGIKLLPEDKEQLTAPITLATGGDPRSASTREHRTIDLRDVDRSIRRLKKRYDALLIEGTGGLMTPISDDHLVIDFLQNRNIPLAFVTNGRPGSINLTLLALDTVKRRNMKLEKVFYNEFFDTDPHVANDNFGYLSSYIKRTFRNVEIIRIPPIDDTMLAKAARPTVEEPERKITISKLQLAELPQVTFPGTITVVETESQCIEAVAWLSKQKIVGFDTETRPSFRKGRIYPPALIQISTARRCFLFRLNKIGFPASLKGFLEKEKVKKVGLSLKDDFHALRRRDPEFNPGGFIELQGYVKEFDIADLSLQKIYGIIFGKRISKNQRLSNWEADMLTEPQQIYAAIDAWASLRIYRYLSEGKFDPSKSKYCTPDQE